MGPRAVALARCELTALWRSPGALVTYTLMPLCFLTFFQPAARPLSSLVGHGPEANGSELSVPGVAVTFGFLVMGAVGMSFMRDRLMGTWDRIVASPATMPEILAAKGAPLFGLVVAQQLVVFAVGYAAFGLRPNGPLPVVVPLLVLTTACLAGVVVGVGLVVGAGVRSVGHVAALQAVVSVTLSGLGGALTPTELMPGWVQAVGGLVPSRWAVLAYRHAVVDPSPVAAVLPDVAKLTLLAVALWIVSVRSFRRART